MNNTECVEVLYCCANLEGKILDAGLWQLEASLLDVVKEILSSHEFENNEIILAILKDVFQLYDIWMLAHFQDFNLSSLLEDFDLLHVGLFDCLNCCLCSISFVSSKFNHAKLTFAEHFTHFIVVKQV